MMMLFSELIQKNLLSFAEDANKLKESTIIDETEAEIETKMLNPSDSENEVPTIPDTPPMIRPHPLRSPQIQISSNNINN